MEIHPGYATQNRIETSYRQTHEVEALRVIHLNQLCTDLVAIKDKTMDPVAYVRYVMASLFDNLDVDLCQIGPRNDRSHEDLAQRLSCLIGFDSTSFKTIISSHELIEEFVDRFSRHAENSLADPRQANNSLYIWLLKGYLYHLLPTTPDAISYVKTANWFRKNYLAKKREKFTTPFRLLKDEVYSELARTFNESDLDEGNVYLRLFHFVELLLVNMTSLSITPTPAQLVSISVLVEYYVQFVLADGGDKDVQLLRNRLRLNHQFAQILAPFLKRNLAQSNIDNTFLMCFEIVANLLYPSPDICQNEEKLRIFVEMSTFYFVDLLHLIVEKMKNSNVEVLLTMNVLPMYTELFNAEFVRILCALRLNATEFLEPIEQKLKIFVTEPEEISPDDSISHRISSFMNTIIPSDDDCLKSRAKLFLKTISERLQSPYAVYPPDHTRSERQSAPPEVSINSTAATSLDQTAGNKTLERSIWMKNAVPDYITDPWTQMYHLTPKGIDQVIRREAQFDFSRFKNRLNLHRPSRWQCKPVYDYLSHLSVKLSRHPLVVKLKRLSKNEVVGPIVSLALQPASPVKGVPVYGKNIPRQPETINLRFFSYYPVLLIIILVIFKVFTAFLHTLRVL
ncbi:unnamed protein product [Bursaphelenchus xylophilus]|uniref:(pine wood nematode) hypothetical protein n=1 Tax=Bursaphelenchus xylophilus TaxID=6326 RepID=A0A1I7SE88_BURXY|nr:unnamed protein product [Bursaphelenchus xylophilus]CAG9088669.1 unnamed protein product [Bursaphelenchus xylophilus]